MVLKTVDCWTANVMVGLGGWLRCFRDGLRSGLDGRRVEREGGEG